MWAVHWAKSDEGIFQSVKLSIKASKRDEAEKYFIKLRDERVDENIFYA